MASNSDDKNKHEFIPIEQVYELVLEESKTVDVILDEKKKTIVEQFQMISDKIKQIKTNAEGIQSQITSILEDTMNTLHYEVTKRSAILKSDRQELFR